MSDERNEKLANDNSEELLARAYAVASPEDSLALYRDWANTYDDHLEKGLHYLSPTITAEVFNGYFDGKDSAILDIGCGTGLTALAITQLGFGKIDGIDISPEMLREARSKGTYQELFEADLTKPLNIPDARYDAAISSGTFTHAHVGAGAFDEIFRILKPGAIFACSINADIWVKNGFGPKLRQLTRAGVMHVREIRPAAFFKFTEENGRFCVFQKV